MAEIKTKKEVLKDGTEVVTIVPEAAKPPPPKESGDKEKDK